MLLLKQPCLDEAPEKSGRACVGLSRMADIFPPSLPLRAGKALVKPQTGASSVLTRLP